MLLRAEEERLSVEDSEDPEFFFGTRARLINPLNYILPPIVEAPIKTVFIIVICGLILVAILWGFAVAGRKVERSWRPW